MKRKDIKPEHPSEEQIEKELEKMDYPPEEDIMNPSSGAIKLPHHKQHTDDNPAADLDIPGAELDDDMEDIGEEDEENNYYSLGGEKED
ncbi:hypothetical protein ACFSQD_04055 [Flavihumibacter stibioxidans]|uniref:Uncharacterized protein n=1 Tax=Flavihumibacter stibioxidans TaxID=1834163 RepID=A0ABR7M386_9BACT|nr:hypothetical protein [Flavihumibacter stibioxidans]MBC6489480.1 hypothetical protein [Flavihumibacter stibioxidans]